MQPDPCRREGQKTNGLKLRVERLLRFKTLLIDKTVCHDTGLART
jgi:hypothetical protein